MTEKCRYITCLVTLTFDLDTQTHENEGQKHVVRGNLAQILSAVLEIFHTHTKSQKHQKQNLMQFTACGNKRIPENGPRKSREHLLRVVA